MPLPELDRNTMAAIRRGAHALANREARRRHKTTVNPAQEPTPDDLDTDAEALRRLAEMRQSSHPDTLDLAIDALLERASHAEGQLSTGDGLLKEIFEEMAREDQEAAATLATLRSQWTPHRT